ncbi:MAG: hypothetical protein ABI443_07085 [Chthoniobacterales bacterium]
MKIRYIFLFPIVALTGCFHFAPKGADPNGVIYAMAKLPGHFRDSVVKVSSNTAVPTPPFWYMLARDYNAGDHMKVITVQHGHITNVMGAPDNKGSKRDSLAVAYSQTYPINRSKVLIDSAYVWNKAGRYTETKGAQLTDAKMALTQQNAAAAPVWTVRCFDVKKQLVGQIVISATTGKTLLAQ